MMTEGPKKPLSRRTDKVYKINPVARELKDPEFRKQKNVNTRKEKNGGKDFYANHTMSSGCGVLRGEKPAS